MYIFSLFHLSSHLYTKLDELTLAGGAGFPVEVYNHGNLSENFMELELLSPLHPLRKGNRWEQEHIMHWSLHRLPSKNVNDRMTRWAVEKLLSHSGNNLN